MNNTTKKCIQKYYLEHDLVDGEQMIEIFKCHYCNGRDLQCPQYEPTILDLGFKQIWDKKDL